MNTLVYFTKGAANDIYPHFYIIHTILSPIQLREKIDDQVREMIAKEYHQNFNTPERNWENEPDYWHKKIKVKIDDFFEIEVCIGYHVGFPENSNMIHDMEDFMKRRTYKINVEQMI